MRVIKKNPYLVLYNFFISGIPILMIMYLPFQLNQFLDCVAVLPFLLMVLCLLPFGQQRLSEEQAQTSLPILPWFTKVLALQLGSILLFLSMLGVVLNERLILPHEITMQEGLQSLFGNTQWLTLLFPWALIAFFAITLGYSVLCKKNSSMIAPALAPLAASFSRGKLGYAFDMYLIYSGGAAVLVTLFLLTSNLFSVLASAFGIALDEHFLFAQFIGFSVVLWYFNAKGWKHTVGAWVAKRYPMGVLYALIMSVVVALGFIASATTNFLLQHHDETLVERATVFFNFPQGIPESTILHWLYWAWWICWTPIIGSYIVRVSAGRSIREMSTALMFVPLLLVGLFHVVPYANIQQILMTLLANKLLLATGAIIFVGFFLHSPHLNHLFSGHVNADSVKKYRSPKSYLQVLPMTLSCGIIFFKMLGYKLMSILLLMSALPAFGIITLMIMSIYCAAWKKDV